MAELPTQLGLDYLLTYATSPLVAAQVSQNDIGSLHPRLRFATVSRILEHMMWGKGTLSALWKGSNALLLQRCLCSVARASYQSLILSPLHLRHLDYRDGPEYTTVVDDVDMSPLPPEITPEMQEQVDKLNSFFDPIAFLAARKAKMKLAAVEDLDEVAEGVNRTGRNSESDTKRRKEMDKARQQGTADSSQSLPKKGVQNPLADPSVARSFEEIMAEREDSHRKEHEVKIDEEVMEEMQRKTAVKQLETAFLSLMKRAEEARVKMEALLKESGRTWKDVAGYDLPTAAQLMGDQMKRFDKKELSEAEVRKDVTKVFDDAELRGKQEVLKGFVTRELAKHKLPFSADEFILLLQQDHGAKLMEAIETMRHSKLRKGEDKKGEDKSQTETRTDGASESSDSEDDVKTDASSAAKRKEAKELRVTEREKELASLTPGEIAKEMDDAATVRWYLYQVSRRKGGDIPDVDTIRDLIREYRRIETSGAAATLVSSKIAELLPMASDVKAKWVASGRKVETAEEIAAYEKLRENELTAVLNKTAEMQSQEEMEAKRKAEQAKAEAEVKRQEEVHKKQVEAWRTEKRKINKAIRVAKLEEEMQELELMVMAGGYVPWKLCPISFLRTANAQTSFYADVTLSIQDGDWKAEMKSLKNAALADDPADEPKVREVPFVPKFPKPAGMFEVSPEVVARLQPEAELVVQYYWETAKAQKEKEMKEKDADRAPLYRVPNFNKNSMRRSMAAMIGLLNLAYMHPNDAVLTRFLATVKSIAAITQILRESQAEMYDERFPWLEYEASRPTRKSDTALNLDKKRQRAEGVLQSPTSTEAAKAEAQAELIEVMSKEADRPISALDTDELVKKLLRKFLDKQQQAASAHIQAELAKAIAALDGTELEPTARQRIIDEDTAKLREDLQKRMTDDAPDATKGSAAQAIRNFCKSVPIASVPASSVIIGLMQEAEQALSTKSLNESTYIVIELLRRARVWGHKLQEANGLEQTLASRIAAAAVKAEEKRNEWQATYNEAAKEYYTLLNREFPSALGSQSTPQELHNRVLVDQRLLGLRNLLTPVERAQFEKMMANDATNQDQSENSMTAEERSAHFIESQLKRSDEKDLTEAARALTEHVMSDEWLRMLISEMDPETATMLSDPKRLHETVLKMLKERQAGTPERKRAELLAPKVAAAIVADPKLMELISANARTDREALIDLCTAHYRAEAQEIHARAQVLRSTILESEACLQVVKSLAPAKRLLFRDKERVLAACERYLLNNYAEIEVAALRQAVRDQLSPLASHAVNLARELKVQRFSDDPRAVQLRLGFDLARFWHKRDPAAFVRPEWPTAWPADNNPLKQAADVKVKAEEQRMAKSEELQVSALTTFPTLLPTDLFDILTAEQAATAQKQASQVVREEVTVTHSVASETPKVEPKEMGRTALPVIVDSKNEGAKEKQRLVPEEEQKKKMEDIYAGLTPARAAVARAMKLTKEDLSSKGISELLDEVEKLSQPLNKEERFAHIVAHLSPEARKDAEVMAKVDQILNNDNAPEIITTEFISETIKQAIEGKQLPDAAAFLEPLKKMQESAAKKEDKPVSEDDKWRQKKQEELDTLTRQLEDAITARRASCYATSRDVPLPMKSPTFGQRASRVLLDMAFETALKAVTYPIEVSGTKFVQDISWSKFRYSTEAADSIYTCDGLKGFYEGLKPALLAVTLSNAVEFCAHESLSLLTRYLASLPAPYEPVHIHPAIPLCLSRAAGYLVSYPFATLSRRMITQTGEDYMWYTSLSEAYEFISEREGLSGLFGGVWFGLAISVTSSFVRDWFTKCTAEAKSVSQREITYHRRSVLAADDVDDRDHEFPDVEDKIRVLTVLLSADNSVYKKIIPRKETQQEMEEKKRKLRASVARAEPAMLPSRLRKTVDEKTSAELLTPVDTADAAAALAEEETRVAKEEEERKQKARPFRSQGEPMKSVSKSTVAEWLAKPARKGEEAHGVAAVLRKFRVTHGAGAPGTEPSPLASDDSEMRRLRRRRRRARAVARQMSRHVAGESKLPAGLRGAKGPESDSDEEEKDKKKPEVFPTEGDRAMDQIERDVQAAVDAVLDEKEAVLPADDSEDNEEDE